MEEIKPKRNYTRRPGLSEKQTRTLLFIRTHAQTKRISPSYDEIAAAMGIGKSSARVLVNALLKKGAITNAPGRYRNVVVTPSGHLTAIRYERSHKHSTK